MRVRLSASESAVYGGERPGGPKARQELRFNEAADRGGRTHLRQLNLAQCRHTVTKKGDCCDYVGAMKAKELMSFLQKYALDTPAQKPDAGKQESTEKVDTEAEDSEDPKDKAVPQVSCVPYRRPFPFFPSLQTKQRIWPICAAAESSASS